MQSEKMDQISCFLKQKKNIILFVCTLIAVFGTMTLTTIIFNHKATENSMANGAWTPNSYRVVVNDQDVGLVATKADGEQLVKKALEDLVIELGYNPEVTPQVRYYEEYSEQTVGELSTDLITSAKDAIRSGIGVIKEKAFVMKIGEDFVVALRTKEEVEQVLKEAQKLYISNDIDFDVQLAIDPNNGLIETPRVILKEELSSDRMFLTASESEDKELTEDDVFLEENAVFDPKYDGTTIEMDFAEDVMVVESYIESTEILSVEEAIEKVTKKNQEPTTYTVQPGDSPSTIAANNDMDLEELYALNKGLKEKDYLQIGDELVVMVPEPELSVTTKEQVVYVTPIARETTYVENPNKYVGSNTVVDYGSDGELQVTAIVTKVNGNEISREVIEEVERTAPVDKVVEKGTKPLPAKGATGSYIPPLASYTLTSRYGPRGGGFHYGVDMAAPTGTTVRAADGGVVIYSGWMGGYGYLIIIDHGDGVTTRYGHNSSLSVSVGQQVSQYQEIAKVGSTGNSTGPHVHFEIRFDGTPANPLNYLDY